jgi:ribosome-associated protein
MQAFVIPEDQLEVRTMRSSGAGGQHVNKTDSQVEIRFHLYTAEWIPAEVRSRMRMQAGSRLTQEGFYILRSQAHRSQERNYQDCLDKLRELIAAAWHAPKPRKKTKPTRGSKERRIGEKKTRSSHKAGRGKVKSWSD